MQVPIYRSMLKSIYREESAWRCTLRLSFEKGIEHAVMEIPPIKIDIKDFQVSTEFHNYKNLRDTLKNDILNLSVRVKTDSKTEKIQHVFSNIEIPTTQKGYTKSDGEKVERIKGEVILEIDPKLTMSLLTCVRDIFIISP